MALYCGRAAAMAFRAAQEAIALERVVLRWKRGPVGSEPGGAASRLRRLALAAPDHVRVRVPFSSVAVAVQTSRRPGDTVQAKEQELGEGNVWANAPAMPGEP